MIDRVLAGEVDGRRRFNRVGGRLEADPRPGEAAHRDAEQAVLDELVDRGGGEKRNERRLEVVVALMGEGARLRAMVVADDRQHPAVRRRARGVGVLDDVHRAVEPRTFAVPDAEHAVDRRAGAQADVLRPPHRGRAELLVEARLEDDVLGGEQLLGAPQFLVVAAERRAAITRDEAAGVEPHSAVARALDKR